MTLRHSQGWKLPIPLFEPRFPHLISKLVQESRWRFMEAKGGRGGLPASPVLGLRSLRGPKWARGLCLLMLGADLGSHTRRSLSCDWIESPAGQVSKGVTAHAEGGSPPSRAPFPFPTQTPAPPWPVVAHPVVSFGNLHCHLFTIPYFRGDGFCTAWRWGELANWEKTRPG